MPALLRWTGHPLVDVGIATLCAMTEKSAPEDLTLEDLDKAAEEMASRYFGGGMGAYLTCVFPNAGYVNATMSQENQAAYRRRVLFAHRAAPDTHAADGICAFSGEPATHLIDRAQLPLSTGAGILNFYPGASGGCMIAGPYLTALQALPLGGRRADGRLLIAHADNPALTLALAGKYLEDNRRYLFLSALRKGDVVSRSKPWADKYPDARAPRSLLLSDLTDILREKRYVTGAVTGYWLTNSGQGPALDIFTIPSGFVGFLEKIGAAGLSDVWKRMLSLGWHGYEGKGSRQSDGKGRNRDHTARKSTGIGAGQSRNAVLEDLLAIFADGFVYPDAAQRFVRSHLLGAVNDTELIRSPKTWKLTELFLTEVVGMDRSRLEKIRSFADRIAVYIAEQNDRRLFNALLFQARRLGELRGVLVKAQRAEAKERNGLLFGLDDYYDVFEAEDAVGITRWDLVRDLIAIRVVEKLHELKWASFKDVIAEEPEDDQSEESAALIGEGN
jgi:CRISPR-associated protein Cst1